jgi:tetraprenyl-beta-curcumene synthase
VLTAAIIRGLSWGLPELNRELYKWRASASKIPNREIRHDALCALDSKRGHAAGAALFAILPRHRDRNLLRLLVAYETIWDFLDTISEHAPEERNGRQLHLALLDAIDTTRPRSDYYKYHPGDDSGFLADLVASCRSCCLRLPGYQRARPLLITEAWRAQVLALNHKLDPTHRDAALREWAHKEAPIEPELTWYELSGAASASLTIHALLALAAQSHRYRTSEITRIRDTYNPWISATTTMLDSYVDQPDDAANGDHSYIAHYPTSQIAAIRLRWLIRQSMTRAQSLPRGEQHTLIVAAMVAMYLSKDNESDPHHRNISRAFTQAKGPMPRLLLPILRLWHITYDQRTA